MTEREINKTSMIHPIILTGIVFLWIYVIKPAIDWTTQLINSITNWLSSNSTEIIYGITIVSIINHE